MASKTLVGVDGSQSAKKAIEYAANLPLLLRTNLFRCLI